LVVEILKLFLKIFKTMSMRVFLRDRPNFPGKNVDVHRRGVNFVPKMREEQQQQP